MNNVAQQLEARLRIAAARERKVKFWRRLALAWLITALVAGALMLIGWRSDASLLFVILLSFAGAGWALKSNARNSAKEDSGGSRSLALRIEREYPELEGRLLTAVQQESGERPFNYLQERLLNEAVDHSRRHDWGQVVPEARLRLAQVTHWLALALMLTSLLTLRSHRGRSLLARLPGNETVTVSPGDTSLERGTALVVLARFAGQLPPNVELVVESQANDAQRIPLVKSLADPMFGGSVPEVATNLTYHIEYAGHRTRDYKVSVFEHPRLERADADLVYPEYTGLKEKRIENTRRVSAVEGTRLGLTLHLSKPVTSAQLLANGKTANVLPLTLENDGRTAVLREFPLNTNLSCDLRLVDSDSRTNKARYEFVFEALKNRPPEIHLTSPRGDLRPSPLEEISFEGTVWDDFGVKAYGLGYSVAGEEPKLIELGRDVRGTQKQGFKHLLRLEDMGVAPDELISWFVWADDYGPDGKIRRTTGDLFFGEVRPFEEVFREGQGMEGEQGNMSGQQGGQAGKLTDLEKQIISATWNLQRRKEQKKSSEGTPANHDSSNNTKPNERVARIANSEKGVRQPGLFGRLNLMAQLSTPSRSEPEPATTHNSTNSAPSVTGDAGVIRDSQQQALSQAEAMRANQRDSNAGALLSETVRQMQKAIEHLEQSTNSNASLKDALSAEQAAYQTLLKLQEHEYQVVRNRNRNQGGGSARNQQMQRQLEQMDLTQSQDRYETERQAQAPQTQQQHEQLQVTSRLQELARRQTDLNERLKELQAALQEARTQQEREEILRRLKRLEEEEQQMLSDVDELRQRMDRPENQSNMAEQRRQLEQTRDDVQRAADAAGQGAASQALAAGTRAERQFQQMHDQMRKENSSQFADDLREMREQARALSQTQEDLANKIGSNNPNSLSDADANKALLETLNRQKSQLSNLVDRATQVSQQAEETEPLLSRQLYDTLRKFAQNSSKNLTESQDELVQRGLMSEDAYERLKASQESDSAKLMDLSSQLLDHNFLPQARELTQRSRTGIDELKRGVEQAAQNVIGDDTEALRQARKELTQLTDQLEREMRDSALTAGSNSVSEASSNGAPRNSNAGSSQRNGPGRDGSEASTTPDSNRASDASAQSATNNSETGSGDRTGGRQPAGEQQQGGREGTTGQASANDNPRSQSQPGPGGERAANQAGGADRNALDAGSEADRSSTAAGGRNGVDLSGNLGRNLDRILDGGPIAGGPITGDDYLAWSDRLREVEEMVDRTDLRNRVAIARDRARVLRQQYRKERKKPDWDVVRLEVMKPLNEVRDTIADELSRRESKEALVPLDRDPVPGKYSELVRHYYEQLGKDRK